MPPVWNALLASLPDYVVFRDSNFADDATLVNFEQIFKACSSAAIRKALLTNSGLLLLPACGTFLLLLSRE